MTSSVVVTYRRLRQSELSLFDHVDRSERIDGMYRLRAGRLEAYEVLLSAEGWESSEAQKYVERLRALHDAGGPVWGAWSGPRIVGLASLDIRGVSGDRRVLQLDMLYVSRTFRSRGIGSALTQHLMHDASSRDASALYVSATPTRKTVDFYLRLGAHLLASPDPHLLAREPDDIHLLLPLG